ncbi:MAG: Abi family protein [Magnetococcales bacterium]|nr:Abi family protein [Magnetococcales bacterium]
MRFDKPPKTFEEQVSLLQSRGMVIDDQSSAIHYLAHLNYYRLTAYWLPFEADHGAHAFKPGTRFDAILNLYIFDRELRLLLMDAIERVEVSLRTQWAYHMAHGHGAHAFMESSLSEKKDRWQRDLDSLREEISRSDEVFIQHYRNKYDDPELPPIWAVCEVMSLGLLSRWFTNLKPMPLRRNIAATYGLDDRVLQSFLRHLVYIRNLCAHHSRLWNRRFTVTMTLPRTKPAPLIADFHPEANRKIYNTLVMLAWMMDRICPIHRWRRRLLDLLQRHSIDTRAMGFPNDFATRSIWRMASGAKP